MWKVLFINSLHFPNILLSVVICFVLAVGSLVGGANTYIASPASDLTNCPKAASPTKVSLLVVLLDRSSSLIKGPTTDPTGYSTSSVKILADVWPGSMIVIPINESGSDLLGPATLSNPVERMKLKKAIEQYPIGGNTLLSQAMRQALQRLQNAPSGSRALMITDGDPTGNGEKDPEHQEQDIRNNLLPKFCKIEIPISTFGLSINTDTADGQDANQLLSDIANRTGATYVNAQHQELVPAVISIFAEWQHLSFIAPKKDPHGNYPVPIDTFAQLVSIIIFRSDSKYKITLAGPDNQQLNGRSLSPGIQESTDQHYEIDTFDVSTQNFAGTYTVNIANDPYGSVVSLVTSSLDLHLTASPSKMAACVNDTLQISANWFMDNTLITPLPEQEQLVGNVELLVNGRPVVGSANKIILTKQGAHFIGQTIPYDQVGLVVIQVSGTFQHAERQTEIRVQLMPLSLFCLPCQPMNIECFLSQYLPSIVLLFFLIALLSTSQRQTKLLETR